LAGLKFWLRELINFLVIARVILFLLSGNVTDTFGPSVDGSSPVAAALNCDIVASTNNTEETIFSPVAAPRVANAPVGNTVLLSPSDNRNFMNSMNITSDVVEDAAFVFVEAFGHSDGASKRTSLHELVHHSLFSLNVTILIYTILIVAWRNVASLSRFAVAAHLHGRAILTVGPATGLVNRTSFIGDVVFTNPFVPVVGISTVATVVFLFARDENLWSNVDIRPGSITCNLDTVREGRGGGLSPARPTVLGDVLVFNVG